MTLVLFINVTTALINEDTNSTLANGFLVLERLLATPTPRHLAHVVHFLARLLMLRYVLQHVVALLENLLFDHVLVQHLVVEGERLPIDQFVVESFTIGRLDDVALRVDAVLVALL